MAHFCEASVSPVHHPFHGSSSHAYRHAALTSDGVPRLRLNTLEDDWEVPEWDACWCSGDQDAMYKANIKKDLMFPPPAPFPDQSKYFALGLGQTEQYTLNKCHLLSLPKELRLQIWKYVLTDPSLSESLMNITREPFSPCYKLTRAPNPKLQTSFDRPRNAQVNVGLLLVNRFIYEEALPILYESVIFAPRDLEGLLPLFLNTLSPYARSHVHRIRVTIPVVGQLSRRSSDPSRPFFHWAVTCAQIAKLHDTLHLVEVEGHWSAFEHKVNRRAILYPLCKIKTTKKLVPVDDSDFQKLLLEADQELKAKAKLREERTKAEAVERAERDKFLKQERIEENQKRNIVHPLPRLSDFDVEPDLSQISGIKQFEKELEEHTRLEPNPNNSTLRDVESVFEDWDLVSIGSGASTPKARSLSIISKRSDESWTDTASTIIGKDDLDKDSKSESGNWQQVDT